MNYCTQNSSATNAWNVNTNNANVNNNSRTNGNLVRAFSDSRSEMQESPSVPSFESFIEAYYDCRQQKRSSHNALLFETKSIHSLYRLWRDIVERKYEIGKSVTFVIHHPVDREVFAASFRDRIVHHWICIRLEPLFEKYFYDRMKANRVKKGTLDAIKGVYRDIYEVSEGYTRDAWIYKFDLQGFFMSIDKTKLNDRLQVFIDERYEGEDKEVLKWLVEKVVMNCPQNNCWRKCPETSWDCIPSNKSLFGQDDNHGLPIGNLTSQWFANFYLRPVVEFCINNGFKNIIEYVDDLVIVHRSKEEILNFRPRLREFLKNELGITLHPRKSYIQHYTKGVSFVGAIIKPHRLYLSSRAMRKSKARIYWKVRNEGSIEKLNATVNSYLRMAKHYSAYKFRKWIMGQVFGNGIPCYFTNNILTMKLHKTKHNINNQKLGTYEN